MYMGYSRPNSPATFFSAASIAERFSGLEKSVNGSFTNSETCTFVSAVAMIRSSPHYKHQFYCPPRRAHKHSSLGSFNFQLVVLSCPIRPHITRRRHHEIAQCIVV